MGKIKKAKAAKMFRNAPLLKQMDDENSVKPINRAKYGDKDEADSMFVDDKLSRKILREARKQQKLEEYGNEGPSSSGFSLTKKPFRLGVSKLPDDSESESEGSDVDSLASDDYYDDIEINEEDEKAFELFMASDPGSRRTLADIIIDKLTEKQTEIHTQFSVAGTLNLQQLDQKVIDMYRDVGQVLSTYRSGKLPKAFKIIPSLANWEQVLELTRPDNWTAASMYQATRIFASNLKGSMAQRFYNKILLPRVRDDIAEYKKLNFHLYQALRKALFKPAAFFKGIVLPLCEARSQNCCTLREAIIISSVLAKNSIPVLQSSAAILKIAEMEYTGANSIFLRTLLDKRYALPYLAIDGVVNHFLRFSTETRELPVLWHQCLLTFVQRYKEDLAVEQKEALLDLLKTQTHPKITPEIRKEIQSSKCRGDSTVEMSV